MKHSRYFNIQVVVSILLVLTSGIPLAFAQARMSDKDIESLMKNLQDDTKKFRSTFDSAVGKSTIRKTSQEKDAKNLVGQFHQQTENMLKQFKSKKKADQTLPPVQTSADQIDKLLAATQMGDQTNNAWTKIKTDLGTLSQQFGTTPQPR